MTDKMNNKEIIISVNDIYKIYGSKDNAFYAINGISFDVLKGSFTSIIGKSGSGKSTLLHLMAGLDKQSKGDICVDGEKITELSEKERCRYRNNEIGFVFQSFYLEESYSVYKNIEMPLIICGIKKNERKKLVEEAAKKVGLEAKLKMKTTKLSGGEKQRVTIARAIVNKPQIIFADEPCGNLDSENGEIIMNLLRDFVKDNITVILVTHNLEDAKKTDRIVTLKDGEVIGDVCI